MALIDIDPFICGPTWATLLGTGLSGGLTSSTDNKFVVSLWRNAQTGTPVAINPNTANPFRGNTTASSEQFDPDGSNNHYTECDWTGYAVAGMPLASASRSLSLDLSSSGKLIWTGSNILWTGVSSGNTVRGALIDWCSTPGTPSNNVAFLLFDQDWSHSGGEFEVEWDPILGIVSFPLQPTPP